MSMRPALSAALSMAVLGLLSPAALADDINIDVSKATVIALPATNAGEVSTFKTPDGKEGWVHRLSNEAIPTPAYSKGHIFTGGGVSSQTIMSIDAGTGKTIWQKATKDSGPTSPVVTDKYLTYNLESCDTELRDPETGDIYWSELEGGSLLTPPLIAGNMLIIPHPTMTRTAAMSDQAFKMLGVDLTTRKHSWEADMTGDVLGAPVAQGDKIFFACTDGRLFSVNTQGGGSDWHVVANATSAPVVVGKIVAVSVEEKRGSGAIASIRRFSAVDGSPLDVEPLASVAVSATVLAPGQRGGWDYQGPKLAALGTHAFNAVGLAVNGVDLAAGKPLWRAKVSGPGLTSASNTLTPPALGKENLYFGSNKGHMMALKQSDGSLVFAYNVSEPLASQPILADGNLYFGTTSGLLVCIKLKDKDADNWTAWGGNAQHNKTE